MVLDFGYPFEKHIYVTEDGYINTMHRICGPKGTTPGLSTGRPVIFFQPGLCSASSSICCNGPEFSIAYALADAGFDLWINNSRGTTYSRAHRHLDPDVKAKGHEKYWEFSFQEMGQFDLPAAFNYVMKETGIQQFSYIGHSMGTTEIMVALADNPDFYRPILNLVILLGPVYTLHECLN